jgi:hypothetical protein
VAGLASLVAQQATSAAHEPPILVLAHPAAGVSVPAENATVIFRYAVRDATDPLDLRSFEVLVDGVERTSHFRTTADAAWGTIADGGGTGLRAHDVRARVCTIRGVCVEVGAIITVTGADGRAREAVEKKRWVKVIDIALEMARRLLRP